MQMAMKDGQIMIRDTDTLHYQVIKSWGKMRWDRSQQMLYGPADAELLNKLAGIVRLPKPIEEERERLNDVQKAVDAERLNPDPEPMYPYPVKQQMYKHQIRGANMAMLTLGLIGSRAHDNVGRGFGFLYEMGLGKSLNAIAVAGAAYQLGAIKSMLVVAPTSVCTVWPQEFDQYADFPYEIRVLSGEKKKRLKALEELRESDTDALKVAVINYENTWREGIFEALKDWAPDLVIADESQRIKTHNAQQSKAMHALGDLAKYKMILSGTPVQNDAIDLYSQYRFLDSRVFGTNFYAFRNKYAIMGGFNKKQIVGYRDLDELIQKEHSIAYRVTKDEALDLPEQTFLNRTIEMDPKSKALYNKIRRDSYAELEDGETVTAPTVLTKLLRLQQFTGGFLQTDDGAKPEYVFDGKLRALEDILDDYVLGEKKKLVIFCRFRPELKLISDLLGKKRIGYQSIYGDVKIDDRGEIVRDFQENPETMVFLAQIDTAGLGITLTAADTCVYYSANFNYASYSQSLARIHRIGQRNACTYIHLVVKGTVDTKILQALGRKEDLAKAVVDNWKPYFMDEED